MILYSWRYPFPSQLVQFFGSKIPEKWYFNTCHPLFMVVLLSHWNLHLFVLHIWKGGIPPYPSPQKKTQQIQPIQPIHSTQGHEHATTAATGCCIDVLTSPPSKKSRSPTKSRSPAVVTFPLGGTKKEEPFRVGSRCDKMIPCWNLTAKAPEKLPGKKRKAIFQPHHFFKGSVKLRRCMAWCFVTCTIDCERRWREHCCFLFPPWTLGIKLGPCKCVGLVCSHVAMLQLTSMEKALHWSPNYPFGGIKLDAHVYSPKSSMSMKINGWKMYFLLK